MQLITRLLPFTVDFEAALYTIPRCMCKGKLTCRSLRGLDTSGNKPGKHLGIGISLTGEKIIAKLQRYHLHGLDFRNFCNTLRQQGLRYERKDRPRMQASPRLFAISGNFNCLLPS